MPRYSKTNVSSISGVNSELQKIATAIDSLLDRDGTSPNYMKSDLDLNSNSILNVANGVAGTDAVNVNQLINGALATNTNSILQLEVTATAGQTVFTVPSYTMGANLLSVYVNGQYQYLSSSYTETSTTSITFSEGLNLDDKVMVVANQIPSSSDIVTGANLIDYTANYSGAVQQQVQDKLDQSVNVMDFGADNTGATECSSEIQAAIDASVGSKLIFPSGSYLTSSTINFIVSNLDVEFYGGAVIKPTSGTLVGVTIGSTSKPSRINISKLKVDRTTYSGATENIGIQFLACVQSTFDNLESRYSKYNFKFAPSSGGFAYNTLLNPQGIGGLHNFWLNPTGTGFTNENTFIGGRGFGTSDLDTNLRIQNDGNGVGHNRFIGVSLEASYGVQAIYDDGDSNYFEECRTENGTGWTSGYSHVMGATCVRPIIVTNRLDYTIDTRDAIDPRHQVISYRDGTRFSTANNGTTTLTLENQSGSRGSCIDTYSTRSNADAFSLRAIKKIASASGQHDGAASAATLTDSGESWTVDAYVGAIILNVTDGSTAIITANDATTITATLQGGTDNDWDVGDEYVVYPFNAWINNLGKMYLSRSLEISQSGYNFYPFQMGNHYFWMNGNEFRGSIGAPTSTTDGALIATLT